MPAGSAPGPRGRHPDAARQPDHQDRVGRRIRPRHRVHPAAEPEGHDRGVPRHCKLMRTLPSPEQTKNLRAMLCRFCYWDNIWFEQDIQAVSTWDSSEANTIWTCVSPAMHVQISFCMSIFLLHADVARRPVQ